MGYVLDNASAKRITQAIDDSVERSGIPNQTLVEALAFLDEWCWEREGDPECVHITDIKGAHETRFYMAPNGDWELNKRWGSWSPSKCVECGRCKAKSNNGWEGKKDEDNQLIEV
tara:strand:+ start:1899 stop:2243 length:345 start_codon:yes stop_codon:yes gene_type:complete